MSIQHTRFIHCADLHLDSRMESHLSPAQAQNRRKELIQTFSRLIDYASIHDIRGILISGDLFDTPSILPSTLSLLIHLVHKHPEIDFLYLPGNHDNLNLSVFPAGTNHPDNLYIWDRSIVGDTAVQKHYGSITITGLNGDISQLPQLSETQINLVMLHGQIDAYNYSSSDNCFHYSLKDLSGKYIDYIAAGHIHQFQTAPIDNRGIYCYSGCLEGRGFDECGEKGFVVLDISVNDTNNLSNIDFQFVPFASRQFFDISLDISDMTDYLWIEQQIEQVLSDINSQHLVRLRLTGTIPVSLHLHLDWLHQKYSGNFYLLRIEDFTHPILNYEDYRYDTSLRGTFIRLVLSDSDLSDTDKEKIIIEGLRALSGEEISLIS